jgi:glyoxylase-like metal-dependent hydrolase (beta-lactamase superfamily II)
MHIPVTHTIDLNFQNHPGTIAVYLLPHSKGAALVESGPGSTIPMLVKELAKLGYSPTDITDVFLTHIHLDHAGAAGWFAKHGATIHVHPNGAPHLLNPEKLIASAARIYGDKMDSLWGEFLYVPQDRIHVFQDGASFTCSDLVVKAMDVPGHAYHQVVYMVGDIIFAGDIGGIRVNRLRYLSLPMPPPEFHLEYWRASIRRLQAENPARIAPTHFGVYDDASWHLEEVMRVLALIENWMEENLPSDPPIEDLRRMFVEFERKRAENSNLSSSDAEIQQIANPSFMSADGIQRYWKKFRMQAT